MGATTGRNLRVKWLTSKVAVATFGSIKASREAKRTSVLALVVAFLLLIGPLTAIVVDRLV